MMLLPEDIEIQFRSELEKIELENHMPYITSIERISRKEGRKEGLLAGKIQILQQLLADTVENEEILLTQSIDQLTTKLNELQQRFDSRKPS